ncbi:MAG TPA: M20/M25/M40 family metallo-hydrolase [Polyangia bacterium]|nr:M20/M25/M40 family metallo-hydrolase [Polyangia bacterium]
MNVRDRLAELVSFDTQNPMGRERPLCDKLASDLRALGAAAVDVADVGAHAYVYARFGAAPPRLLLNAHVDTVPANSGYTTAPHALTARDGRLVGLGAADTKGAIAAILCALASRRPAAPLGVLFSGDEERSGSCMRAFLDSPHARGLERAVVCEPTSCRVGARHRGIGAAEASTTGPGGHSSRVDFVANPIAILARAAVALDDFARQQRDQGPEGFRGICLNVAAIGGGIAFNVIPTRGSLLLSLRPAPGTVVADVMAEIERRARAAVAPHPLQWEVRKVNPAFTTRDLPAFEPLLGARARQPVDLAFWTEAALLSEAGIDAVVFGPGDIAQAHATDEFVAPAELEKAQAAFEEMLASLTSVAPGATP